MLAKFVAMLSKFAWSVRRRGVAGSLGVLVGRLGPANRKRMLARQETHPFDLRFGVDTSSLIDGTRLFSGHPHDAYNTAYWGVSPSRAEEVLRRWQASLTGRTAADYTFVDVGCGKGRMMLIAAMLPFREVIGVELNAGLAATAAQNAAQWTADGRAQCAMRVVQQDATEMTLPNGPCVMFLYNPFGAPVLRKFMARLEEHFAGHPGELDLIYLAPEHDDVFAERGGYTLLWRASVPQTDPAEPEDMVAPGWQPCSAYRR